MAVPKHYLDKRVLITGKKSKINLDNSLNLYAYIKEVLAELLPESEPAPEVIPEGEGGGD